MGRTDPPTTASKHPASEYSAATVALPSSATSRKRSRFGPASGFVAALLQVAHRATTAVSAAAWSRLVPRRIAARTGAAVGLIDHVTKDPNSRGRWAIGGQAKMSGLTGASYMVEVARIFGEGLCGEVVLRLGKDRPGTLKRHCGPMRKADKTQEAARVVIDSTGDKTVVTVNPWKGSSADGEPQDREPFRPTYLMEQVSRTMRPIRASTRRPAPP